MKREIKEQLKCAYEAPAPLHKKEFLRNLERPRMRTGEFMLTQMAYIRKWVWGVSIFIFAFSMTGALLFSLNMLWGISALTPLLALIVVSEGGRSQRWEMEELEMATRFSLRSVMFARLGILGIENIVILGLLWPVAMCNSGMGLIRVGIYMITPFLLTTFVSLYIVRKCRGDEANYICAGAAVCIGFSVFFVRAIYPQIYQGNYFVWWIAAVLALGIGTIKQYCIFLKQNSLVTEGL